MCSIEIIVRIIFLHGSDNWGNASQSKVSTDIWKKEFHNVQFKLQNDLKESRQLLQRKDVQLKEKEEELKRVKIAQGEQIHESNSILCIKICFYRKRFTANAKPIPPREKGVTIRD